MNPKNIIVKQTSLFGRQKKKLHKQELNQLDNAVNTIIMDSKISALKKGDLADARVYKFQSSYQKILLAYKLEITKLTDHITLLAYGAHENFYSNLKKHRKK